MKAKKSSSLVNSRARYDYELGDEILAGLVLSGAEVKSIRSGRASLKGAFVSERGGELWLNNLQVSALKTNAKDLNIDELSRPRKLLLKKSQIDSLLSDKGNGQTIVPTKITTGRYIKVYIAPAKGKKRYDKRQVIKRRDSDRASAARVKR